jgi:chromosome transmission fidelity protein 4
MQFDIHSVEHELLHIHTALDLLDEELTTDSIITRERAMDKEFIILIQGACKADNIPRALELTKLLHQLSSFDAAMKIADFYHLPGFREKAGTLKTEREENEDRLVVMRDKRRRWMKPDPQLRQVQMQNYGGARVDPLGDVRPPPAIERPGMARVTVPVIETTRYRSGVPPVPPQSSQAETQLMESPSSTSGEGKRKRVEVDDDVFGSSSSLPMAPPPKQSKW